ncbi:hypothetical protein MMC31_000903 [Peltigera leucophlebia]|nr:hypothetical protein [Peltigera leucophlebia]
MPAKLYIPLEIISSILDHLPSKDLRLLRTVSKTFLHLINPRVFSEIKLYFRANRYFDKQLILIKSFSSSSTTVCSFVTIVRKITLSSIHDSGKRDHNFSIDGEVLKAITSEHLAPFLARLQNLETVDWNHQTSDEPSLYLIAVSQSLSFLPKLRNVAITLDCDHCDFISLENQKLPPLHTFKNLSSLSISCSEEIPRGYCNQEIATAIAASLNLTRLSLKNRFQARYITEKCSSLQSFLGNATSPQLTQLELHQIPLPAVGLDQTLLYKLKSLTISTWYDSRVLGFACAKFFTTLEEIGVELSQLSVTGMEAGMDEMFSYLISYADGLEILEIRHIKMDSENLEESAGRRFWDQIVPHHKNSLKTLVVMPNFEGAWCYGPMFAAAIQQCFLLRNLTIAVRRVDSAWAEAKISLASANKEVQYVYLGEPYGLAENSAALILNDFPQPLAQLTLITTSESRTRTGDMWPAEWERRTRIIENLNRLILGLRATSLAADGVLKNWPLKVLVNGYPYAFQLRRSVWMDVSGVDDGDKWQYQRGDNEWS